MTKLDLPTITSEWMSVLIAEKYDIIQIWFDTQTNGEILQINFEVAHSVDECNQFGGFIRVDSECGSLISVKNKREVIKLYYLRNIAQCNDMVNRLLATKDTGRNPT